MLVQKKADRRQIILLASILGVIAVIAVVFVIRRFSHPAPAPAGTTVNRPTVNVPLGTISNVNAALRGDPRFLELRARSGFSPTAQVGVQVEDPDAPAAPQGTAVFDPGTGRTLSVTWRLPADARISGVRVYRSLIRGDVGEKLIDLPATQSGYQDQGVENFTTYYYLVRTTMTSGKESTNSGQVVSIPTDVLPPAPPTNVASNPSPDGRSVIVTWVNPTDSDFSHVRIYRSAGRGQLGDLLADTVTTERYEDTTVNVGGMYYYTVVSVDQSANASPPNLLSTPGKPNPFLPTFD